MSENIPENSPVPLKRFYFVLWTMLSVVLISSLCAVFLMTRPVPLLPVTPAGEIFEHLGTYVSPNRLNTVEISINPQGNLSVKYQSNVGTTEMSTTWNKSKVWFAAFDEQDRLLCYRTGGDLEHAKLISFEVSEVVTGITHVGIGGDWEGIPQSFLDKLPESEIKKYETWKRNKQILPPANKPEIIINAEEVPASSPAN